MAQFNGFDLFAEKRKRKSEEQMPNDGTRTMKKKFVPTFDSIGKYWKVETSFLSVNFSGTERKTMKKKRQNNKRMNQIEKKLETSLFSQQPEQRKL